MKKRVLTFVITLVTVLCGYAQDTIITTGGDIITAYDVEVGGSSVFYKKTADAEGSLKMNKADVLMIKHKDGSVERLDAPQAQPAAAQAAPAAPAAPAFGTNPNLEADNLKLVRDFNSQEVVYLPDDTQKKADGLCIVYGITEGSIIETPELRASFSMKKRVKTFGKTSGALKAIRYVELSDYESLQERCEPAVVVTLKNLTDKAIYLDLANSFFIKGEDATPYFIPSATTSVSSRTSGGSVNMGAVAGALGVGGSLGRLAGGVNVGGATTNTNSTTTYSQRIVSVPPMASISLSPQPIEWQELGKIKRTYLDHFEQLGMVSEEKRSYKITLPDFHRGDRVDIPAPANGAPISIHITYSMDEELSQTRSMRSGLYIRQFLGTNNQSPERLAKQLDYSKSPVIWFGGNPNYVIK